MWSITFINASNKRLYHNQFPYTFGAQFRYLLDLELYKLLKYALKKLCKAFRCDFICKKIIFKIITFQVNFST